MNLNFFLPKQYYVAVQDRAGFSTDTYPLGFATHVGTDKAYEKRKSTVDSWAGVNATRVFDHWEKDGEGKNIGIYRDLEPHQGTMIFDNVPTEGFSFDRVVARYRTDNKLFRIQDPRGFTLEISSENLGDILINSSISKGFFVGEYVWARTGGKNYLLRTDHPLYAELTKPKTKQNSTIYVGDVINTKSLGLVKYMGKFYVATKKSTDQYDYGSGYELNPRYSWSYGGSRLRSSRKVTSYSKDEKPWHIFVHADEKYKAGHHYETYLKNSVKLVRSLPTKFEKVESPSEWQQNLVIPTEPWVDAYNQYSLGDVKIFADKASLKEYVLPETEYEMKST